MNLFTYELQTEEECFIDITRQVRAAVKESAVPEGLCVVYCPHTTGGITINENADPDVVKDMLLGLRKAFPHWPAYCHFEGNSTAHLRASAVGFSQTILVQDSQLILGRWQGIYFCEFDGPRSRKFHVKVMEG